MKYLYDEFFGWIEEKTPIIYKICHDGISIQGGSLLGSGFEPECEEGITLPKIIKGIPVTELAGCYSQNEIGYIEAKKLKRINIQIVVEKRCKVPGLCGGLQNTVETFKVRFLSSDIMHINPVRSLGRDYITEIIFDGTVVDDADWENSSFETGLFKDCCKLKSIRGDFKGYRLSGNTFEGCKSLVHLPDLRVKYMGGREFYNCTSLRGIHLCNGLKEIGCEIFKNCVSLEDIFIPDTVEVIGSGAFEGCVRLKTIHLPKHLAEIPERMFAKCEKLQKVFLSDDVEKIGIEAFMGCTAMKRPWLPKKLLSIGERAFYGCTSIQQIYLPENLSEIGADAFANCDNLVIHGKQGTLAERYAKENRFTFVVD